MKIRALDDLKDWKFGKGLSSYAYDNDAIAENLSTRIKSWKNDCWFDMEAGIDWPRLLGSRNTQAQIVLSIRAIILQSYGVTKVNSIETATEGRSMTITFNINTIFSTNYEGEVTI